jgi:hypothetical protein
MRFGDLAFGTNCFGGRNCITFSIVLGICCKNAYTGHAHCECREKKHRLSMRSSEQIYILSEHARINF